MVGIPAPAIVGRSVGPATIVPDEVLPEVELAPVVVAEEEKSVLEASSVDVALEALERVLDARVEVLVGSSLVLLLRSGRSLSCAITTGAPARASSASSCAFLARRTMFAVVAAFFERRMATMRLHRCYGMVEVCAVGVFVFEDVLRPAFPCLPVSDGPLSSYDDSDADTPLLGRLPCVCGMMLQVAARKITYASAGKVQETVW